MATPRYRRTASLSAVSLGLLLFVSACSIASRPASWPSPKASGTAASGRIQKATGTVPTVSQPWRPGLRQLGIQVYWTANTHDSATVIRAKAQRIINYAIGLNANSIGVSFPFYTYGITSSTVYASRGSTPSPADIGIFLSEAAKSRMRVTLRPILNENSLFAQNPLAWRGSIEPAELGAWFWSYRELLTPYAEAAQSGHAATFVIGTELNSLQGDPNWSGLVAAIRAVYHGQLYYDENFDDFAAHDTELPLPAFGVDAYPRFDLPDDTSVDELARAWEGWLGTHALAVRRKVILYEVGIAAVAGSYPDPGAWLTTTHAPIDLAVQTRWFEAACRAVAAESIGGVYWWEVSFDADPAHPSLYQSDRLTFLGRPAQDVIRSCFASLSSEEPPSR